MTGDVEDVLRIFGRQLRLARRAAGLTQEQLGQKVGLSRASIANMEAGKQNARLLMLKTLGNTLNVDIGVLVGEEEDPRIFEAAKTLSELQSLQAEAKGLAARVELLKAKMRGAGNPE